VFVVVVNVVCGHIVVNSEPRRADALASRSAEGARAAHGRRREGPSSIMPMILVDVIDVLDKCREMLNCDRVVARAALCWPRRASCRRWYANRRIRCCKDQVTQLTFLGLCCRKIRLRV
jgi:hypothetical protein